MTLPLLIPCTTNDVPNFLFPFKATYTSSTSLSTPAFMSAQSLPLLDYSLDIYTILYSIIVSNKILKEVLDAELTIASLLMMMWLLFRHMFPQSKCMLRHIFTLTLVFIFDYPDYTWSGVYQNLVTEDSILFNTCAVQVVRIIIWQSITKGFSKPDISAFHTHICVWAVAKHLHLMIKFRRSACEWVQVVFGLKVGETNANKACVADALTEGNLVQTLLIIIIVM